MLDFLRSLSELNSLQRLPWRWWVTIALGMGGMIVILMNVQDDIAVLYVFLDLVLTVVVATAWQWNVEGKSRRRGADK